MIKKWLFSFILLFASGVQCIDATTQKNNVFQSKEIYIDSNHSRLFCRVMGKGKPLIVIHGGPGLTQDYLLPQLYRLAETNFVIFYDQKGCGRSTGEINQDTINIPTLVNDIESIRKAFNFDKVSILGHSWGGFLAMHYAIAYPKSINKLILSNSMPASSEDLSLFINEYARRTTPFQDELSSIYKTKEFQEGDPNTIERVYRKIFRTYCNHPEKADFLSLHMSPIASVNGAKIYELLQENTFKKPFNLHDSLKTLQIPTLIIHGNADPIPAITARNTHLSIQGSKYILLENCGHFPYIEQPDAYFNSLKEFLTTSARVERRVAFDIGSGQIKMQVSDVDLKINKIVNILLTDVAYVGLREHLVKSLDGRLSSDIQNKTVDAISGLMKKAAPFHPEAYHAIATEALRLAKNADMLVDRIEKETGVHVTIVSQEEEGILGFISAVSEADVDFDKAISWDLGGGSFQITAKTDGHYSVYQGRLGKTPMKNALLKIQGKDADPMFSPNPISKSQAIEAIEFVKANIKNIPIELQKKLNHPDVVVLGIGINPLWGMQQSTYFDKTQVLKELNCRLNLDDAAIRIKDSIPEERKESFTHVVSNLILAYGIMEALNISQVHYVGTQGANAVGALLSPKYWINTNEMAQEQLYSY
jgi:proline iminopeptidase